MGRVCELPTAPTPFLTLSAEGAPATGIKWFSASHLCSRNNNSRQNFSGYGASPIPELINIFPKIPFSERLLCPWH